MPRRPFHRLTTALLVVMALLFSQLALANYLCPEQASAATMGERMAAGLPCEGLDADQPALCAGHSADAPQSAETAKPPTLSAPLLILVLQLPLALQASAARTLPPAAVPAAHPPPDPLFLSTRRLRV